MLDITVRHCTSILLLKKNCKFVLLHYFTVQTNVETFPQNVEGCRDGSAKNHRNLVGDGSDQARQDIQKLHK